MMRNPTLRRSGQPISHAAVIALLAAVLALFITTPAWADTASLSFTDASGKSDPVAQVGRTMTLAGNTPAEKRVWLKVRATGGAPCAPSYTSDSGSTSFDNDDYGDYGSFSGSGFNGAEVNGDFSLKQTGSWNSPGTYMFCIWFANSADASTSPITQTITFRAPSGTISATVSPPNPQPGENATVTVTGSSESPEQVYATIRPAGGAACAGTYDADSGTGLISGTSVNGAFSIQATTTQNASGDYLICLWLAGSSSDTAPVAGPQPVTFTVGMPPAPVDPVTTVPAPSPVPSYSTSASFRRRGARYSGRVTSADGCVSNRAVHLRVVGRGGTSFATARTRLNGTFTVQLARRLRGRVYVSVAPRVTTSVKCRSARSRSIRG